MKKKYFVKTLATVTAMTLCISSLSIASTEFVSTDGQQILQQEDIETEIATDTGFLGEDIEILEQVEAGSEGALEESIVSSEGNLEIEAEPEPGDDQGPVNLLPDEPPVIQEEVIEEKAIETIQGTDIIVEGEKVTETIPMEAIEVDKKELEMIEGEDEKLNIGFIPENTTDEKSIIWEVGNPEVATIDLEGNIKAVKAGFTMVTAQCGEKEDYCLVNVKSAVRPLERINFQYASTTIEAGKSLQLEIKVFPADTTDIINLKEAIWECADENVAIVADGRLQGVNIGTTTVTAKLKGKVASCKVTVTEAKTEPVEEPDINYEKEVPIVNEQVPDIDKGEVIVPVSGTYYWEYVETMLNKVNEIRKEYGARPIKLSNAYQQSAMLRAAELSLQYAHERPNGDSTPFFGENIGIVNMNNPDALQQILDNWMKSDGHRKNIVDDNFLGAGFGFFFIPESNMLCCVQGFGYSTGTTNLSQNNVNQSTNIVVSKDSFYLRWEDGGSQSAIDAGSSETLKLFVVGRATVATNGRAYSSNEDIATVEQSGNSLTIQAVGRPGETCTINYEIPGAYTITRTVSINAVPIQNIQLDKTEADLLKGKKLKLSVSCIPENTTDDKTTVWSTSDSNTAIVSQEGEVIALRAGTVIITATVAGKTATCAVTVKEKKLEGISLNKQNLFMEKGKVENLSLSFQPEDTTDEKEVSWHTSDKNIVVVENGKVTAIKAGTATISAKCGIKEVNCTVTVGNEQIPLNKIAVESELQLTKGNAKDLNVSYFPENTTDNKELTWSSSDESIVTVQNGTVTGVGAGMAVVTVICNDKAAECKIIVEEKKEDLPNDPGSETPTTPTDPLPEQPEEQPIQPDGQPAKPVEPLNQPDTELSQGGSDIVGNAATMKEQVPLENYRDNDSQTIKTGDSDRPSVYGVFMALASTIGGILIFKKFRVRAIKRLK